jgi:Calcium binding
MAAGTIMARATKRTNQRRGQRSRTRLPKHELEALIEEAIVDAYGESEQRVGFLTMLEEHLAVPFLTEILGVAVRVNRVDLNDGEEIVAICRRAGIANRSQFSTYRPHCRRPMAGSGSRRTATGLAAAANSVFATPRSKDHRHQLVVATVFVERLLRPSRTPASRGRW